MNKLNLAVIIMVMLLGLAVQGSGMDDAELVDKLSNITGLSKKTMQNCVGLIAESIIKIKEKQSKIDLLHGNTSINRTPRRGRNPQAAGACRRILRGMSPDYSRCRSANIQRYSSCVGKAIGKFIIKYPVCKDQENMIISKTVEWSRFSKK